MWNRLGYDYEYVESIDNKSKEDIEIIRLFEEFSKNFDRGGLEERYVQEQIFNDKFCVGIYNNYYAEVEEYCVMCTVTRLRKKL